MPTTTLSRYSDENRLLYVPACGGVAFFPPRDGLTSPPDSRAIMVDEYRTICAAIDQRRHLSECNPPEATVQQKSVDMKP